MIKNNPKYPPAKIYKDKDILDDISNILQTYGIKSLKDYKKYGGKYSLCAIANHFGSWTNALKILNIEPEIHYFTTKEELDKDVIEVIKKTNNTKRENYLKHGKYSRQIIKKYYKTWNNLLLSLGYDINMYKKGQYTEDNIIDDYMNLCIKYDQILGSEQYRRLGKFSQPILDRVFGSFTNFKAIVKDKYYDQHKNLFDQENVSSIQCSTIKSFISAILGPNFYSEYTFNWLINDETQLHMYIDIYYPQYKLAIEVDGGQHYKYVEFIHKTYDNFLKQQYRDKLKDKLLKQHGIDIIRIKPYFGVKAQEKLKKQLIDIKDIYNLLQLADM